MASELLAQEAETAKSETIVMAESSLGSELHQDICMGSARSSHGSCFLKPTSVQLPGVHFPHNSLEREFRALSDRTGSTSTPFVTRTLSTASAPFTPYLSESSLNDSAVETSHVPTFSNCLSARLGTKLFRGGVCKSARSLKTQQFASVSECDSPMAMPKAVLFPMPGTNIDNEGHTCSHQTNACIKSDVSDQCVLAFPQTQPTDIQADSCIESMLVSHSEHSSHFATSHLGEQTSNQARHSSDDHRSLTINDNKCCKRSFQDTTSLQYSSESQSTADTGYESQMGFELSAEMSSTPASSSQSSFSPMVSFDLVISQFAPKHLDRLIGRKMGLDHVDIISQLHSRNLLIPLKMILQHLSRKDLKNMSVVSEEWNIAVNSDLEAYRRKASPRKKKMESQHKENQYQKKPGDSRQLTAAKNLLSEVQATAPEGSTFQTTPSVSKEAQQALNLSRKYWMEAEKLKNEECLRKCPKCCSPSKMNPGQERAWCANVNCGFDFCVKCHRDFHGSKDCGMTVTAMKKTKTDTKVGSKRSKKNLRRL